MLPKIRNIIAIATIATFVVTPVSLGFVILSTEEAAAKSNGKGNGAGKNAKVGKQNKKRTNAASDKSQKQKVAKKQKSEKGVTAQSARLDQTDQAESDQSLLDGLSEETDTGETRAFGNPGNDKEVGRAGENPNGDESGWGGGSLGRSDAERDKDDVDAKDEDQDIISAVETLNPEDLLDDEDLLTNE